MAYEARVHAQDAATGRLFGVLDGIDATATGAPGFTSVDVAVAYATRGGVDALVDRLQREPGWASASKRWLVSIDFGFTEPAALEALAKVVQSDVRVPNGLEVVARTNLAPRTTFHAKGYLFRGPTWGSSPTGLIVGSANLSISALTVGSELMTRQSWFGSLTPAERGTLDVTAKPYLNWFEDVWASADPLLSVLPQYKAARKKARLPRFLPEDRTPLAKSMAADPGAKEVHGALEVQLANCKSIWFETGHLYENRGVGKSGNQLDTPRGTRVFFGFNATKVSKNSVLGHVQIQVPGFRSVQRSIRFANNQMDKVNLPLPGSDGPSSYDNRVLIFDRQDAAEEGRSCFSLTVTDSSGLAKRKQAAVNAVDLAMQGGRPYGLLF